MESKSRTIENDNRDEIIRWNLVLFGFREIKNFKKVLFNDIKRTEYIILN
jgi:hypothetical protein